MTGNAGRHLVDLATFFLRAWPLRFAAILLAAVTLATVTAGSIADSLQLSASQRADSVLGAADARVQLPGSAPIGSDGRALDEQLRAAVSAAGGAAPTVDYLATGLQPDGGDETSYSIEEIQRQAAVRPRLRLVAGNWSTRPGQALVSEAVADTLPIGSTVTFFNGALKLDIVGTFRNAYDTGSRAIIVPEGTWSSLRTIEKATAQRLHQSAGRIVAWSDGIDDQAIVAAVRDTVLKDPTASAALAESGDVKGEFRAVIEQRVPAVNVTLLLATFVGPLVAGLIAGLLAGAFTGRVRTIMWTVGVPYKRTRNAAGIAVLVATLVGAIVGTLLGIVLGYALRPLLASLATQDLGPVTGTALSLAAIPIGALGALVGALLARRPKPASRVDPADSREGRFDLALYRIVGAIVLASLGVFIGTGANDIAKMSLAALAIALAMIVALAPIAVGAISRISPRSFASRLALRKFAAERGVASLAIIAIAGLQVLGCTLAILVTSTVDQVNATTESPVRPGQIVFEPEVDSPQEIEATRKDFEKAAGLSGPVLVLTVGAGNERADGATRVVASTADLERVIDKKLTTAQAALLEDGGSLLTKPVDGDSITFPPTDTFPGASLPALTLGGLDPSFRNISGFVLASTAQNARLPVLLPSYVYTDVSSQQVASAKSAASTINLNPDWVTVYHSPDELAAPLRVSAITALVALVAGLVLLLFSTSQARSMRPELAGLRAVGVSGTFLSRVVGLRMALTFLLATAFGLATSAVGVAAAFSLAHLGLGVTVPLVPLGVMVGGLAIFTAAAAFIATRRLRNSEWLS